MTAEHPCVRQNSAKSLQYLKAASNRYDVAKRLLGLRAVVSFIVPLVLIVASFITPSLEYWGAFFGIVAVVSDQFLLSKYLGIKREGAKAQELFDCHTLHFGWNETEIGPSPPYEAVVEWSDRFGEAEKRRPLTDWYPPELSQLPLMQTRLACQRIGTHWDYRLRSRYSKGLVLLVGIVVSVVFTYALASNWSMRTFVIVGATILPTVRWTLVEYQRQRRASTARKHLRGRLRKIWRRCLGENCGEHVARQVQDALFVRRANDPDVFNWIYLFFRERDESRMREAAKKLVEEWRRKESAD